MSIFLTLNANSAEFLRFTPRQVPPEHLLVVNPAGERWAVEWLDAPLSHQWKSCRLYVAGQRAVLVEIQRIGNGGSLNNVASAIALLRQKHEWTRNILVTQNGGLGSRIAAISHGNKGSVEVFAGKTMFDLSLAQATDFSVEADDCVHLSPVDMLQNCSNSNLHAELFSLLKGNDVVVCAIPVDVGALNEAQLRKWGFIFALKGSHKAIGFVEHPGTLETLLRGFGQYRREEVDVYFSVFRFFMNNHVLREIASIIEPEISNLAAHETMDLSDHVIEAYFLADDAKWQSKVGRKFASMGKRISSDMKKRDIGISLVSMGECAISEDLGTFEALQELQSIAYRQCRIWQKIKPIFEGS